MSYKFKELPHRIAIGALPGNVAGERADDQDEAFLSFDSNSYDRASNFLSWLKSPLTEVRLLEQPFLHSKVFLLEGETGSGLMVGSQNLTRSGLLVNLEAAFATTDPTLVSDGNEWFEQIWSAGDPEAQGTLITYVESLLGMSDPLLVWLRFVNEALNDNWQDEKAGESSWLEQLTLFQADGVIRAYGRLNQHRGAIIADEVGLGKTYMGLALAERYLSDGGNVLILVPPAVLPAWQEHIDRRGLSRRLRCGTYGTALREDIGGDVAFLDGLRLLILDEAHLIRSERSEDARVKAKRPSRRESVLTVLAEAGGRVDTLMLTATPVNNGVRDLRNLLKIFVSDDHLSRVGIPSLAKEFAEADQAPDAYDWARISLALNGLMVRRTRQYIRDNYGDEDGTIRGTDGNEWRLPRLLVPKGLRTDHSEELNTFQEEIASALDGGELALASYRLAEYAEEGTGYSHPIHLMYTTLLKRWESSPPAFAATCDTFLEHINRNMEQLFGCHGTDELTIREDYLDTSVLLDGDQEEAEEDSESLQAQEGEFIVHTIRGIPQSSRGEIVQEMKRDRELLENWRDRALELSQEPEKHPKVTKVLDLLRSLAESHPGDTKEARDQRKIIIFTSSKVTAEWLYAYLSRTFSEDRGSPHHHYYRARVTCVTGDTSSADRRERLTGFAPETYAPKKKGLPPPEDRFDVLIATDVLSEGVNLQQAGRVLSFDLPWNPARLVQRIGRVDRLHSPHNEVHSLMLLPPSTEQYRKLLRLEAALRTKSKKARRSTGMTDIGLFDTDEEDKVYDTPLDEEEEERLRQLDLIEAGEWPEALMRDAEALRARLDHARANERIRMLLGDLPIPAGATLSNGEVARLSYVFCLDSDDESLPSLMVAEQSDEGAWEITPNLAKALAISDPEMLGARQGGPPQMNHMFEAWDAALKWLARHTIQETEAAMPSWAHDVMEAAAELVSTDRGKIRFAQVRASLSRPLSQADEEALKAILLKTPIEHVIGQLHFAVTSRKLLVRVRSGDLPVSPLAWMQIEPA